MGVKVAEDMNGAGELLVLGYNPGLPCLLREASLDTAIDSTDINTTRQQITIPGQVQSAYDATTAWAAAHPEGSASTLAVWSCFDDPATGAAAAVADLERTDIKTYGLNGTAEAIKLVREGKLTATLWINGPAQGEEVVKLIIKYLEDPEGFEPIEIGTENIVVDSSNVEQFIVDHPQYG
jgi:ABC-type sugar transport system substrate-binding protein